MNPPIVTAIPRNPFPDESVRATGSWYTISGESETATVATVAMSPGDVVFMNEEKLNEEPIRVSFPSMVME